MRAFVAIEIADEDPGRAPAHLTVRFLGDVGGADLERIVPALSAAAGEIAPFDLTLGGLGAFPSPTRPRVVWVGVRAGADRVREVAARVADALERVGVPPEAGEFVPHVTLFRVRSPRDIARARALLDGTAPPPPGRTVAVPGIVLKESVLAPDGPRHRVIRTFPFAPAPGRD